MEYVIKNIKTFDDLLKLEIQEIEAVLSSNEQVVPVFVKCFPSSHKDKIISLAGLIPRFQSKLKDELSYLGELSPQEIEGSRFYILKILRKLQHQGLISGFRWELPPEDIYFSKQFSDGIHNVFFLSGNLACSGEYLKGKRISFWKHNYDNGLLYAEGNYNEGLKTGVWNLYYTNGNKKASGKYRDDLKHGCWKEWDRHGVESEVEYDQGKKKI
jgi:hypothetical protein